MPRFFCVDRNEVPCSFVSPSGGTTPNPTKEGISVTTTNLARRSLLLSAIVAMLVALISAPSASATTPVAAVVEGEATLDGGIGACWASGSFSGTAVAGIHGTDTVVRGSASASFDYCNTQINGEVRNARITIDGHTCGFSWQRQGVVVVITFTKGCTGAGVATFAQTGVTTVAIAGVGVIP